MREIHLQVRYGGFFGERPCYIGAENDNPAEVYLLFQRDEDSVRWDLPCLFTRRAGAQTVPHVFRYVVIG